MLAREAAAWISIGPTAAAYHKPCAAPVRMRVIYLAAGVETNGGVAEVYKFAGVACRGERGCRECKIQPL